MHIQPVPFQKTTGPNGWSLDLVPHPFVGMAGEAILGYYKPEGKTPTMRSRGHPSVWSKRIGQFTVWAWPDGSIAVKPLSGAPIPFPMWLHQHATYPTHMPSCVPTDLDLDWLRSALLTNAFVLHKRPFAEVASGNTFTDAYPLWWVNGRNPGAKALAWDSVLDTMADVASAWHQATGTPTPKAMGFSVMGGLLLADGTILPATIEDGYTTDPVLIYLRKRFAPLLSSVRAVAIAWSADDHIPQGQNAPQRTITVPVLTPGPITLLSKTLKPASAHLVLEVRRHLDTCTG